VKKTFNNCVVLLAIFLLPGLTMAENFQSLDSIHAAARQFLLDQDASLTEEGARLESGKLDSRLRLRQCSQALEGFLPAGGRTIGNITVGVRCADDAPWSLYVPVRVSVYRDVVVAAELLSRGSVLTADDVRLASVDLAELPHGYLLDISDSIGKKLKRRLQAGTALTPMALEQPQIIKRGQRVTILARSGRMEVRMAGKALDHGAVGKRIGVVNLSSKQKLEGVVTESGEVMVDI
jgi:flagella basal body P-ring formation protein FlgA